MDYRVHITNEKGEGVGGSIYLYDSSGNLVTVVDIPVTGGLVPGGLAEQATTFHIDSPGYIGYDILQLADMGNYTLVKEENHAIFYVVVVLLGLAAVGKLLKL